MFTQDRKQSSNNRTSKSLRSALVAISALVLLQGCKTMEKNAAAFGDGLIHAAAINRQNREDHQRLVDWQNSQPQSAPLPFRQPAASQPVPMQQVTPAQSNNPSQVFLNQGMWSRPGN